VKDLLNYNLLLSPLQAFEGVFVLLIRLLCYEKIRHPICRFEFDVMIRFVRFAIPNLVLS
jgi:hypothetical protein